MKGRLLPLVIGNLLALSLNYCNTASSANAFSSQHNSSIAICITGQLIRLELGSKIENLVKVNLRTGHHIDLFVLLDNQLEKHKAVKRANRYSPDNCLYRNMTADKMMHLINSQISIEYTNTSAPKFSCRIRLEPPKRTSFVLTGLNPVCIRHNTCDQKERQTELAKARFQNHMRQQASLRECFKWVQDVEHSRRHFYDYVVRMREDTYVFAPFAMSTKDYVNSIVVQEPNGWGGLNDHNVIIDRKFADLIFRGLVEDYYFGDHSSLNHGSDWWGGPEILLLRMSTFYGVQVKKKSICLLPFAPIDGRISENKGNKTIFAYSMGKPNNVVSGSAVVYNFKSKCPFTRSLLGVYCMNISDGHHQHHSGSYAALRYARAVGLESQLTQYLP